MRDTYPFLGLGGSPGAGSVEEGTARNPGRWSRLCEILSGAWSHISAQDFLCLDSVPPPTSYSQAAPQVYHSGSVLFGQVGRMSQQEVVMSSQGQAEGKEMEMPEASGGTGPVNVATQPRARQPQP